jgi:hypothetical protein
VVARIERECRNPVKTAYKTGVFCDKFSPKRQTFDSVHNRLYYPINLLHKSHLAKPSPYHLSFSYPRLATPLVFVLSLLFTYSERTRVSQTLLFSNSVRIRSFHLTLPLSNPTRRSIRHHECVDYRHYQHPARAPGLQRLLPLWLHHLLRPPQLNYSQSKERRHHHKV